MKNKSTAHAQFLWHVYLRAKGTGERFTVGRHRGLLAQTGLKTADCLSSARRLRAPSAVCPFLPGCSHSQIHTCAERGARNFLIIQLISGIFPLCLYLRWTKGSQGFKLIMCDRGPLCLTPLDRVQRMQNASRLACPKDTGVLEELHRFRGCQDWTVEEPQK